MSSLEEFIKEKQIMTNLGGNYMSSLEKLIKGKQEYYENLSLISYEKLIDIFSNNERIGITISKEEILNVDILRKENIKAPITYIVFNVFDIKNNDMESYLCKDDDLKEVYKNLIKTLKEKNINVSFRMSYGFPGRYELNCFYNVQNYITFPHDIVNDIIRLSTDKPIDGVNDIVCRMRTFDYDCPTLYKDIYLPNELENENIKGNQKRISLNSRI